MALEENYSLLQTLRGLWPSAVGAATSECSETESETPDLQRALV